MASRLLDVAKTIDKRMWWDLSPLRQFNTSLNMEIRRKLEDFDPRYIVCNTAR